MSVTKAQYDDYPRLFSETPEVPKSDAVTEAWRPTVKPSLHERFRFTVQRKDVEWSVYYIVRNDKPETLVFSTLGGTRGPNSYYVATQDGSLDKEQVLDYLDGPYQYDKDVVLTPNHPLDPYSAEDRKRFNEECWAAGKNHRDECGYAAFRGPFIGPWIEHSHHRYSRSWHPSLCGGGPAAVVQGFPWRWFAWHNLMGHKTGATKGEDVRLAMAEADAFLAEDQGGCYVRPGGHTTFYPLAVNLKIEASLWTLARAVEDQWIRTWKDWPEEKALAARIRRVGDEFHYTCWGLQNEGHIGFDKANDLETAKRMADRTLRTYCQAFETWL